MKTLMKSITLVALTIISTTSMAVSPVDITNPGYVECSEADMNTLEVAASVGASRGIRNLILETVIPGTLRCQVEKPRFFHPAVCGTAITQIDTYMIQVEDEGVYSIVVDSSYRSCLRKRIIPVIKSLEFSQIQPTFFP